MHLEGSAYIEKSKVNLSGTVNYANHQLKSTLKIYGSDLNIVSTDKYQITASPDLVIDQVGEQITISGTITIPKANISPQDFYQATTLPPDVVFINQDEQEQTDNTRYIINSDIKLVLEDKVQIHYQGLDTGLKGTITIHDDVKKFATAQGTLELDNGKYTLLGKEFTIKSGKLLYAGGMLKNPGLNITAERQVQILAQPQTSTFDENLTSTNLNLQQLTAGVNVSGTLERPEIDFFSKPVSLSRVDIISYLLLGKPVSQASPTDAQLLLQAANMINIGGGNNNTNITQKIKNTLKLDTIGLETLPQTSHTALGLGKYITPKLYLHYTVGLEDPINIVKLRYLINKHWYLETEASEADTSADIFYTLGG